MHIRVQGNGPVVVFTAGAGVDNPSLDFESVTSLLIPAVSTAVYDRPGFGKSEATVLPRDIDTQVSEMDVLFSSAELIAPFVLVGHSIGSLECLRYAQVHPDKVRAIVLIDATPPKYIVDTFKETGSGSQDTPIDREVAFYKSNAERIIEAGPLQNIPITYIYAKHPDVDWGGYQASYESFSQMAKPVPVDDTEHFLHHSHPELVSGEILSYLNP